MRKLRNCESNCDINIISTADVSAGTSLNMMANIMTNEINIIDMKNMRMKTIYTANPKYL